MRMTATISLLLISALLVAVAPSQAWGHWCSHGGVFIGVWPGFWWGAAYPYWWYPSPYYGLPQVGVREPSAYVQRQPSSSPGSSESEASWYYCQSANGYYPYVQTCPEAWVQIPTRPR